MTMTTAIHAAAPMRGHPVTRLSLTRLRQRLAERLRQRALRREYREMLKLDDTILRDIGVTRGQIWHAARMPLSEDAEAEIAEATARNRAA